MSNTRVSKKYKVGDSVMVTVNAKSDRKKTYIIQEIDGSYVILTGYKTRNRAQKITDKNTENYKPVNASVHISNIIAVTKLGVASKVAFIIKDGKKVRILKKDNTEY